MVDLVEQMSGYLMNPLFLLMSLALGGAVSNLPLCTVAGFINTLQGPIIGILHHYAYYGEGTTIHSVPQLLHFSMDVDEKSSKSGMGKQCIITPLCCFETLLWLVACCMYQGHTHGYYAMLPC